MEPYDYSFRLYCFNIGNKGTFHLHKKTRIQWRSLDDPFLSETLNDPSWMTPSWMTPSWMSPRHDPYDEPFWMTPWMTPSNDPQWTPHWLFCHTRKRKSLRLLHMRRLIQSLTRDSVSNIKAPLSVRDTNISTLFRVSKKSTYPLSFTNSCLLPTSMRFFSKHFQTKICSHVPCFLS